MFTNKRTCIFCDSPKLSKEHIYPRWLLEIYTPEEKTFRPSFHIIEVSNNNGISDKLGADISDGREIPYESFTVKNVCEDCNSGWMSNLESNVKPILLKHINDPTQEIEISSLEANLLSQWAVLKCMLASLTTQNKVFFSKMAYKLLQNGIIPEGFIVELGKVKYKNLNFMIGGLQIRKAYDISREELDLAISSFYKASLQIGYAALRISFLRTEIPVFRKQIQFRLFLLHPYNSKIPFEEHPDKQTDYGPKLELPILNSFIAIID